jgi:Amt family ammonium transporter
MGACIGAVVGLVAITPAAGFVTVGASVTIGVLAAAASNAVVHWKSRTDLDDTLDVFPCHGVGGIVGMLLTGVFATTAVNAGGADGLAWGNPDLFLRHLAALGAVAVYSLAMSWALYQLVDMVSPLRVTADQELRGLDLSQHAEQLFAGD